MGGGGEGDKKLKIVHGNSLEKKFLGGGANTEKIQLSKKNPGGVETNRVSKKSLACEQGTSRNANFASLSLIQKFGSQCPVLGGKCLRPVTY